MKTQSPKTCDAVTAYLEMLKQSAISDTTQINDQPVRRFVATVNHFLFSSTEIIAPRRNNKSVTVYNQM